MRRQTVPTLLLALCLMPRTVWAGGAGAREMLRERYGQTNIQFGISPGPQTEGVVIDAQTLNAHQVIAPNQGQTDQPSRPAAPQPAAADFAIYQADYHVEIEEEIALVRERVQLEVFQKRGARIPLVNASVGLKEVSLNQRPSTISREGQRYVLVILKPGKYRLDVQFFVKLAREREHGPGVFAFDVLPSPISILDVEMAEPGMEIMVHPSIKIEQEHAGDRTLATAVLPYTEQLQVRWTKAAPKVTLPAVELAPKLFASTSTLASIGEGVVQLESRVRYSVLQSEVSNFKIALPAEATVLDVQGPELRDWKVLPHEDGQLVDVYLSRGVKGVYELVVVYERIIGEGSVTAELPSIRAVGAEREQGVTGVVARTNVEIALARLSDAAEIDVKELPAELWNLASTPLLLGYKYLKHPHAAAIQVTKHRDAQVLVAAIDAANYVTLVTDEGKTLTGATLQVRNNVKQFMRLDLPAGAEFLSCFVSGNAVKPAQDQDGRILIPLEKSETLGETVAQFPVEIFYLGRSRPLGFAGSIETRLPKLDVPTGQLSWLVYAPEEFQYARLAGDVKPVAQRMPLGMLGAAANRGVQSADQMGEQWASGPQRSYSQTYQREAEQKIFSKMSATKAGGALPIRITIPATGRTLRFSKLLVTDEGPWLRLGYVRNLRQAKGALNWLALLLVIAMAVGAAGRLLERKPIGRMHWLAAAAGTDALVTARLLSGVDLWPVLLGLAVGCAFALFRLPYLRRPVNLEPRTESDRPEASAR